MKEFRFILWSLYACTTTVTLSLIFFVFVILPILNNLHHLENEWNSDITEIMQGNNEAWNTLMSPEKTNYMRRRRDNEAYNQRDEINQRFYDPKHNSDQFPSPHQLYNYKPERPEFGYGYAKLRCCCALKGDQSNKNLRLSYKCPIGVPGRSGLPGQSGLTGIDGAPGSSGDDYPFPEQLMRRENFGIQSQFSHILPPPAMNCGSCPQGLPGEPGPPGKIGEHGARGIAGRNGMHGTPGFSGSPGQPGDVGPRGRPGARGPDGVHGLDGVKGATGPKGVKGLTGPTGVRGSNGPFGQTGGTGEYGTRGEPGPHGIKGQRGLDGADGVYGELGIPGQDALYCQCPQRSLYVPRQLPSNNKNHTTPLSRSFDGVYPNEILKPKKYLIENSYPPSTAPRMPSYYSTYHYDSSTHQYQPTASVNYQINTKTVPNPLSSLKYAPRNDAYSELVESNPYVDTRHLAIQNRQRYVNQETVESIHNKIDSTMLTLAPTPPPTRRTTYRPHQNAATTLKAKTISRYGHEPPPLDAHAQKTHDTGKSRLAYPNEINTAEATVTNISEVYDELPFNIDENWYHQTSSERKYPD